MSNFASYRSSSTVHEKRPAERGGQWHSRNSTSNSFQGQPLKANSSLRELEATPMRAQFWREKEHPGRSARSGNDSSSWSIQPPSSSKTFHTLHEPRHKKPRLGLRERDELQSSTLPPSEPSWPAPQSLLNLLTPTTQENTETTQFNQFFPPAPCGVVPKENLRQTPMNNELNTAQVYEMSTILREVYGFAFYATSSTLGALAPTDFSSKKRMQVSVGIDRDEPEFFASPLARPALEFLNNFADKDAGTVPAVSDLSQGHPRGLENAPRLQYLIRPVRGLYVFDFGERATRPWLLAVEKAAVALYIVRMDPALNTDYEIARSLVHRGIAFHTVCLLPRVPPTPVPLTEPVPIRPPGYKFTVEDYRAYSRRREVLLRGTPRGRAALLKGGIVWRLAVETLNLEKSLDGPSGETIVHRRGKVYPSNDPSSIFCDDDLSTDELDDICGVNYVLTGTLTSLAYATHLTEFFFFTQAKATNTPSNRGSLYTTPGQPPRL